MFVLCFEQGKFDSGIKEMMATYLRLLNDESKIWSNLVAVITKVGWSNDYENIDEWNSEMDQWKVAL